MVFLPSGGFRDLAADGRDKPGGIFISRIDPVPGPEGGDGLSSPLIAASQCRRKICRKEVYNKSFEIFSFTSLKKLKNMDLIFCKLKKAQKT